MVDPIVNEIEGVIHSFIQFMQNSSGRNIKEAERERERARARASILL